MRGTGFVAGGARVWGRGDVEGGARGGGGEARGTRGDAGGSRAGDGVREGVCRGRAGIRRGWRRRGYSRVSVKARSTTYSNRLTYDDDITRLECPSLPGHRRVVLLEAVVKVTARAAVVAHERRGSPDARARSPKGDDASLARSHLLPIARIVPRVERVRRRGGFIFIGRGRTGEVLLERVVDPALQRRERVQVGPTQVIRGRRTRRCTRFEVGPPEIVDALVAVVSADEVAEPRLVLRLSRRRRRDAEGFRIQEVHAVGVDVHGTSALVRRVLNPRSPWVFFLALVVPTSGAVLLVAPAAADGLVPAPPARGGPPAGGIPGIPAAAVHARLTPAALVLLVSLDEDEAPGERGG